MKKLLFALSFVASTSMMAQDYKDLWKEYDLLKKDDRPASAIEILDRIYKKAETDNNLEQMFKSYVFRCNLNSEIGNMQPMSENIRNLEMWFGSERFNKQDKAVIATLLVSSYIRYIEYNFYRLSNVTPVFNDDTTDIDALGREELLNRLIKYMSYVKDNLTELVDFKVDESSELYTMGNMGEFTDHRLANILVFFLGREVHSFTRNLRNIYPQTLKFNQVEDYNNICPSSEPCGKYDLSYQIMDMYLSLERILLEGGHTDAFVVSEIERMHLADDFDFIYYRAYAEDRLEISRQIVAAYERLLSFVGENSKIAPYIILQKVSFMQSEEALYAETVSLIDKALKQYKNNRWADNLLSIKETITRPVMSCHIGDILPGEDISIVVKRKNIDGFNLKIYKAKEGSEYIVKDFRTSDEQFIRENGILFRNEDFALDKNNEWQLYNDTLNIAGLPQGRWFFYFTAKEKGMTSLINDVVVSKYTYISTILNDKKQLLILDAKTGKPLKGVGVDIFSDRNFKGDRKTDFTDESGVVELESDYSSALVYENDNDFKTGFSSINSPYYYNADYGQGELEYRIYTDRLLYRPGQKVKVSGFVARPCGNNEYRAVAGKELTVSLKDLYGNISDLSVETKSDDFGTFVAEFTLPQHCRNGHYNISVGNTSCDINIEEYKLPSFEVKLDAPQNSFKIGDTVMIKGNSSLLAGAAVQNAKVTYKVERGVGRWTNYFFEDYALIDNGEVMTDASGNFSFPVVLSPMTDLKSNRFYSYRVSVAVTSQSGETREDEICLYAGDKSYLLDCDVPQIVVKDDGLTFMPSVNNLANKPVDVQVNYELKSVLDGQCVLSGVADSNKNMNFSLGNLKSGQYLLELSVDDGGQKVNTEKKITLFSLSDELSPVEGHMWTYQLNKEVANGEEAEFMLGTTSEEAYFIMLISDGKEVVERRDLILNNEMQKISIPMYGADDSCLGVYLYSIKEGLQNVSRFQFKKKQEDKKLRIKWNVFRDKLKPGQKEEWNLTILNPDGSPAKANLMAYMYDDALDMIVGRNEPRFILEPSFSFVMSAAGTEYIGSYATYMYANMLNRDFHMPTVDTFSENLLSSLFGSYYWSPQYKKFSRVELNSVVLYGEESVVMDEVAAPALASQNMRTKSGGQDGERQIRTNFAETAFFYPRLRTDAEGKVSISFTLPESMTRWHFNALAHTVDFNQVQTDTIVVANKDLMLMPDFPRFVRVGDKLSIASSVLNRTENGLEGNVTFEVFDPVSEKIINTASKEFNVGAGGTERVVFDMDIDERYEMLGVRIVADCPTFSDGEQRYIPVLSDKTHIIETVPFIIEGGQKKEYDLKHLFNGHDREAENKTLTVDVTTSPVWMAVEALPALGDIDSDNAISNVIALYANLTANYILTKDSKFELKVKEWSKALQQSDAPLSPLEKNHELKNILLNETPWLLDAEKDSERMRRLVNLFDANNIAYLSNIYADKIVRLQQADGGIAWFAGGRSSQYVTEFVVEKLLSMRNRGIELPLAVNDVLERAVKYLSECVVDRYQSLMKNDSSNVLPDMAMINYAYLHAVYDLNLTPESKFVYDFVIEKLPVMISDFSVSAKSKVILLLAKEGKKREAERFFTSLKEYSVDMGEEGIYFPSVSNYYGWGDYPVVAHVMAMNAYEAMGANKSQLDKMKLWLLQQKRTQDWGNEVATVDAVDKLIWSGSLWTEDNGALSIKLGKTSVKAENNAQSGFDVAGRYKVIYDEGNMPRKISDLTVEKEGYSPSWGAVYAQYDLPYDRIKESGDGMQISKKTYIRRIVDGREVLLDPAKTDVKVGDEYVSQLVFSVDRDMDFVHIRDKRAACAEPGIALSGYRYCGNVWTYVQVKDSSTDYFFDFLKKGEYVLQATYRIDRSGTYTTGNAEIQSLYAPEFSAHSVSGSFVVK